MSLLFVLFTGFTIGITGAIIPGPFTLFTASEVLKTNRFAGFKILLGHIIIELLIIIAIFFGFHKVFTNKEFLKAVSAIGSMAFIIMGALLIMNSGKMRLSDMKDGSGFDKGIILGGIFFSIASPGFIVWWATIGFSTIARASLFGITGVIVLILGHWLADVLWYGSLSCAVDKGKAYLSNRMYHNIIRSAAILLIILGVSFLSL